MNIHERANTIVQQKEQHDIDDLFEWKKRVDKSKCHCPSCEKERKKVDHLLSIEVDRLNHYRHAY